MVITKRVWCLHNGQDGIVTRFVNKQGEVCNHSEDYCWWQELGLFMTKAKAIDYAYKHHIKMAVHSMTIHTDWLYELALEDMIKEV